MKLCVDLVRSSPLTVWPGAPFVRHRGRPWRLISMCLVLHNMLQAQHYHPVSTVYTGMEGPHLNAKFGWCMAVAGDLVAVGSPHFESQKGRATVFNATVGTPLPSLVHMQDVLANPTGTTPNQQRFGASLAMDDRWLVAGNCSPFGTVQYCNASAARVTLFQRNGSLWQAFQNIQQPAWVTQGAFGRAVAIGENILAVGGSRTLSGGVLQDVVYLYERSGILWPTLPTDSLFGDGNVAGDDELFGQALALREGRLLVGAGGDDELGTDSGAAYLFAKGLGGVGNWGLVRKILASNGGAGDRFGTAVALAGERCAVGAPKRRIAGISVGAAYVFDRDAGFPGNWGETAYLEPIGTFAMNMDHGASLAIGPQRIAVGAPLHSLSSQGTDGSVHVYKEEVGGWAPLQRIVPFEDQVISVVGRAGTSLAFQGERLLIGAPFAIVNWQTPPATTPTGVVLVYAVGAVSVPEQEEHGMQVWPNPVADRLYVSLPSVSVGSANLYDALGRSVLRLGALHVGVNSWDVGALEAGTYFLQVELANGARITRKLVRQ